MQYSFVAFLSRKLLLYYFVLPDISSISTYETENVCETSSESKEILSFRSRTKSNSQLLFHCKKKT